MEEKRDLRVQKTYDALIAAFQELLAEKPFEQITVKELCARAKTRTATFYTHFSDKYDFFSFMVKELRKSFARKAALSSSEPEVSTYYTALVHSGMEYLEHNSKMANSIKGTDMLMSIMHYMPDEITQELREHLCNDAALCEKLNQPDVLLQFLIGGLNQVVEWWFTNTKKPSKDSVAADVNTIVSTLLDAN